MPHGYSGLAKRRSNPKSKQPSPENSASSQPSNQFGAARYGSLHVVGVERRSRDRYAIANFAIKADSRRGVYPIFKRVFDIVGAILMALVLSPLIVGIVGFSFASGGSPLYRHRRVGQYGEFFDCLKFRTMVDNADHVLQKLLNSDRQATEEWLRDHKLRDDPRITRLGRFLRKTSLDELPQLWNVLRGEMSLVGPRPVVRDELGRYGRKISTFLSVRPGITGLWQISGRNDIDYRRRVALDVCYVRSRSLTLDLYILFRTLPAVVKSSGAY
jgi:exopolysaccharide production protein ExoY